MTELYRLTAADLEESTRRAAGWLAARGVAAGDRVVVAARNHPATLAVAQGALRSGVVPVLVSPELPPDERDWIVGDARPAVVVDDPAEASRDGRPAGGLADLPLGRPMFYTSGTSGRRKGVWSGVLDESTATEWAADEQELWAPVDGMSFLVCSPLSHSAGYRAATAALLADATVLLLDRFDAASVVRLLAEDEVTGTFFVPTHLRRIVALGDDLPRPRDARRVLHAGEPCPEDVKRRAVRWLEPGELWEFYGSTEGQFTAISPAEWSTRPASVGRARPGRQLAIADPGDDGVGTVFVTAPPFARWEYWGDPAATAAAWRGDAFTAGDLGRLDVEGYLFLVARRDDLIISGGVNVYAAEVERTLLAHPSVEEAVVFGVPDDDWGQRVTAVVAARATTEAELNSWARERLEPAHRPKSIEVRETLPRTSTGKIDRRALRPPR
ncbi:MAG TPA: AMP-binding protein [Actinomycetota bacterium]|nr:AMP-binding protein [Actinomycetota bacterium]